MALHTAKVNAHQGSAPLSALSIPTQGGAPHLCRRQHEILDVIPTGLKNFLQQNAAKQKPLALAWHNQVSASCPSNICAQSA